MRPLALRKAIIITNSEFVLLWPYLSSMQSACAIL